MRLPIISPSELSAEQKPIYDDMRDGIAKNFQGFVNIRDDGALLGPWNPWIHEPKFGKPVWELTKTMVSNPSLPSNVREVAILVTGAHFKSAYELYAHVIVAEHRGLSDEKLATIVAGQRPIDLTRPEAVAACCREGSRHPRHRRAFQVGLRTLRACDRRGASRLIRREAGDHCRRPASRRPHAAGSGGL